jgi:tetratricopeptide (TPR) repeat protein
VPVLHLLAALDEPTERPVLEMAWSALAAERGWHLPPERFGPALADLAGRGLVEEQEAGFSVLPVLRSFLIESDSAPAIAPEALEAMHRDLARFFWAVSNSFAQEANKRLATTADPRPHAELVGLTQRAFVLLHSGPPHSLEQSDIDRTAILLEEFVHKAAGRVAQTRIAAHARALRRRLDRIAETDQPQSVMENMGAAYGIVGDTHALVRDWGAAIESYQQCLPWLQKAGWQDQIGTMHHKPSSITSSATGPRPWKATNRPSRGRRSPASTTRSVRPTTRWASSITSSAWTRALESYQQALAWKEKTGQHDQVGGTYHQVGMVYEEQRDWPRALESYQQALKWNEKSGQYHRIGGTYHQVGRVYEEQHHWPKALDSYQQALAWKEKTGQHDLIGMTCHHVGTVYYMQRNWSEALESYRQAIAWKEKSGQYHQIGSTYHQVGMVCEQQHDWPSALESYRQALAWKEKTDQHHEIGGTLAQLGSLYEEQGDYGGAARHYQEALECFLTMGYTDLKHIVLVMRLLKQRFSEATDQEDLAPVRQRFERMLAEHQELQDVSESLDREREGEA